MHTQIAQNIYSVDHKVAEGKNALIIGQRGAIIVDTGTFPEEGLALSNLAISLGYQPDRLIYTHGHGDHILGSTPFREAEVYAHARTPPTMRRMLPDLAHRAKISEDELADKLAWPTVTFTDELYIDLGDRLLHLFPTPGHSPDGISIFLEPDRLLIAGDSVVTGIVPAIGDGDSRILEASLTRLSKLDIETLLPGHGPIVHRAAHVQEWFAWLKGYLSAVRIQVQSALDSGLTPEQVVQLIDFDQYIGDRLPKHKHNMPKRHQDTVNKIIREELAHRDGI